MNINEASNVTEIILMDGCQHSVFQILQIYLLNILTNLMHSTHIFLQVGSLKWDQIFKNYIDNVCSINTNLLEAVFSGKVSALLN